MAASKIIPANPGFNALTLYTNRAGRLSYHREAVIAWDVQCNDSARPAQQNISSWASPVLPGSIGIYDEYDAIEHPTGAIQAESKTFNSIADWLSHEETKRAKP